MMNPCNKSRDVTISNELGLHARAAAKIVKIAQNSQTKVWLIREGQKADASSVIDILSLACPKGSTITIEIDGRSDSDILNAIAILVEKGFGE
jgi:phosphocarrier protein